MEMYRRTYAEIDLDALEKNISALRGPLGDKTFFCPMVKANAYGHGDVQVSRALELMGIHQVGVCLIEEGLLLRNFGVKSDILVFRGFDREGARKILEYNMTPVVSAWDQIEHLEAVATTPVQIHLKFDTGMNRLGFATKEAPKLFERLWQNPKVRLKALVTHLSHGEDANSEEGRSSTQLRALSEVARTFKAFDPIVHALNSAGIIHRLELTKKRNLEGRILGERDWGCRPGLAMYGFNPVAPGVGCDLAPVMNLKSQVGVYRTLAQGETVSYGGTWTAQRDSVIAVVPIGYADGYHRILSNRSHAIFRDQKVPVVGTVCMDYLMLDVTDAIRNKPDLNDHDVILFGRSSGGMVMSAEELARHSGTITWEVLTSIGERVPRLYKGAKAALLNEEPQ
ncbi:MAG: alanine racemase [Bdellovibrionaceae bacterium]|nr:alanine racemase [Pseudobdellovibrionaceae bacterium]